jgi:hypothetical protein
MPDAPDFDQITRTVLRAISDNIRGECPPLAFGPVRSALVQIWNARGAADLAKVDAELSMMMGATMAGPYVKNLDRALRGLDRVTSAADPPAAAPPADAPQ